LLGLNFSLLEGRLGDSLAAVFALSLKELVVLPSFRVGTVGGFLGVSWVFLLFLGWLVGFLL
jgi:hypothetical protein